MALRFLTGDPAYYNVLARGTTTSSSADALFPLVNLYDGDPSKPFKYGSAGADLLTKVDAAVGVTGNMNSWSAGAPVGWTKTTSGTGTVTQDSVIRVGASGSSAKFTRVSASDVAQLQEILTVRAGQRFQLQWQIRYGTGPTTANGILKIKNLATGRWLGADGEWSDTEVTHASVIPVPTSDFVSDTVSMEIEDFLAVGGDTCQLQITLRQEGLGDLWFDEVHLIQYVDFFSIHGHNYAPAISLAMAYSDDDSTWTRASLVQPRRSSFYGILAGDQKFHRYWRLRYRGTPLSAIYTGEAVLGQIDTALHAHLYGWETRFIFDQIRTETRAGNVRSHRLAQEERRALKLAFELVGDDEFEQLRDQWARRTYGGHYPMIVIPDDTDPQLVLHGRMTEEWSVIREFHTVRESGDILIAESGLPTVTG
jgi:hypothetical protein